MVQKSDAWRNLNKPSYDVRLTRLAAASFWVNAAEKDSFFPNRDRIAAMHSY
jgi:hypothetical protein